LILPAVDALLMIDQTENWGESVPLANRSQHVFTFPFNLGAIVD